MDACDRNRTDLTELLAEGRDAERPAELLGHVRSCEACARELRELRAAWASLARPAAAAPPVRVRGKVLAYARDAVSGRRGVSAALREPLRRVGLPVAVGTATTALIVAAMSLRGLVAAEGATAAAFLSVALGGLLAVVAGIVQRTPLRLVRSVLVASVAAFAGYVGLSLAFPIPESVEFCRVTLLAGADVSMTSLCLLYLGMAVLYAGVPAGLAAYVWADARWRLAAPVAEGGVLALLSLPVLGLHFGVADAILGASVLSGLLLGATGGGALGGWARRRTLAGGRA